MALIDFWDLGSIPEGMNTTLLAHKKNYLLYLKLKTEHIDFSYKIELCSIIDKMNHLSLKNKEKN